MQPDPGKRRRLSSTTLSVASTLRVGLLHPVLRERIDPFDSIDHAAWQIARQLYERPYYSLGPGVAPRPELFAGRLVRDRSSWIGEVRSGACFSDGTPLDARRVAEILGASAMLQRLLRFSAHGSEVHVVPLQPVNDVEAELAKPWASIAKAGSGGGKPAFGGQPASWIGSGPYVIADDAAPGEIRLTANPHHLPSPAFTTVEFRDYSTRGGIAALCADLERGDVDFTTALARHDVDAIAGVRKLFAPGSSTAMLWMNTERLDVAVRRAIQASIDRHALAKTMYESPAAFTARSPLPPRMATCRDTVRHDPETARRLLAPAKPRPLTMIVIWGPRTYMPRPDVMARAVVAQLQGVGLAVTLVSAQNPADYQAKLRAGTYDLVLGGWNADTDDPADFVEALLSPNFVPARAEVASLGCNFSRWREPKVVEVLRSFRSGEPGAEAALLELIADAAPLVPLVHGPSIAVHRWEIEGFTPDARGFPRLADLTPRSR
jgi:ABC-type transport system substrate-binding protein